MVLDTYSTFRDVMKYWLPYRGNYNVENIYMNLELLNSLSDEDQQIIRQAAKEVSELRFGDAEAEEKTGAQKMRDYGIEVVEFTPAEYDAMAEAVVEDVWPELESMVGKKLMDEAIAYFEGLSK